MRMGTAEVLYYWYSLERKTIDRCGLFASDASGVGPEEILSLSLETLYNFSPIIYSSAGGLFTYIHCPEDPNSRPLTIAVAVPDTQTEH
ncbi:hypothetical protein BC826DRAFT_1030907 [Russula brevipes]|nr:hypothetical protein BC826DRAFT_1030907 [Russula brevipes]